MTKLQFPTLAERTLTAFRTATKTVSLAKLARKAGAQVTRQWPSIVTYTFDDDTSLVVTGRGRQHRVEAHLP